VQLLRILKLADTHHMADCGKFAVRNLNSLRILVDQVQSNWKTPTRVVWIQALERKHQHGTGRVLGLLGFRLGDLEVVHACLEQIRSATRRIVFGGIK
jgi:diketogulonate reductase-like aldo/keto reductase